MTSMSSTPTAETTIKQSAGKDGEEEEEEKEKNDKEKKEIQLENSTEINNKPNVENLIKQEIDLENSTEINKSNVEILIKEEVDLNEEGEEEGEEEEEEGNENEENEEGNENEENEENAKINIEVESLNEIDNENEIINDNENNEANNSGKDEDIKRKCKSTDVNQSKDLLENNKNNDNFIVNKVMDKRKKKEKNIKECDKILNVNKNDEIEKEDNNQNVEENNLEMNLEIETKDKSYESEESSYKDSSFEEDPREEMLRQALALLDHVTTHEHAFDKKPIKGDIRFTEFDQVISKPIWIEDIRAKVLKHSYSGIAEVVSDIRLMLENTYRFFGAYHSLTKRALKLEQALEQRIALFPNDLRVKCALEASEFSEEEEQTELPAILRKKRSEVSSRLLRRVMDDRNKREKARRQKFLAEPTPQKESMTQRRQRECLKWEKEHLLSNGIHEQIKSMWEIAQIGQWLGFAETALHIEVPSQWEIERMLLLPQESRALASVMTALLSAPNTRIHLPLLPPMPYRMWTHKLNSRVARWYRLKPKRAWETLGIELRFWDIVGTKNPLEQYAFHELNFHQRVWLLKSLCDNVYTSQKSIRECISEQSEETKTTIIGDDSECLRATILGEDSLGRRYLTFPGLMGREVRIYREDTSKLNKKPLKDPIEKTPKRRKRSSGWKNGQIIKRKKKNKYNRSDIESDSSNSFNLDSSSRLENETKLDNHIENEKINGLHENVNESFLQTEMNDSQNEQMKLETEINNDKINESVESIVDNNLSQDSTLDSKQIVKSLLDEILNRVISDSEDDNSFLAPATSLSPICDFLGFDVPPASAPSPVKPRDPLHQIPEWLIPDSEEFYLIADNLDTLRALAVQVYYDTNSKRTRRSSDKESKLAKALKTLAEEYEIWELELEAIEARARERLYKDYQDSKKRSKKYVDPNEKIWQEFLNPPPETPKEEPSPKFEIKPNILKEELSARASRLLRRQEERPPSGDEPKDLETSEEAKREFHFRKAKIRNEENLSLLTKEFGGVIYSDSESLFSEEEEEDDGSDTWLPPEEKRRRERLKNKSESENVDKEIDKETEIKNSDINIIEINDIENANKKETSNILIENIKTSDKIQVSLSKNKSQIQQQPATPTIRQRASHSFPKNNIGGLNIPPTPVPIQILPKINLPPSVTYTPRKSTPVSSQMNSYTQRNINYRPKVPNVMNSPYPNVPQILRQPIPACPPTPAKSTKQTPVIVSTISLANNPRPLIKNKIETTPRKRRYNNNNRVINNNASLQKNNNSQTSIVYLSDDDDIEIIEPIISTPKTSPTKLLVNRPNITITPVKKTCQQLPITPPPPRPILEPNLVKHFSKKGVDIFLDPRRSNYNSSTPSSTMTSSSNDKLIIVNTDTGSHYALLKPDGSKVILTQNQLAALRAENGGTLLPLLNR